jgi:hypothetical protein
MRGSEGKIGQALGFKGRLDHLQLQVSNHQPEMKLRLKSVAVLPRYSFGVLPYSRVRAWESVGRADYLRLGLGNTPRSVGIRNLNEGRDPAESPKQKPPRNHPAFLQGIVRQTAMSHVYAVQ